MASLSISMFSWSILNYWPWLSSSILWFCILFSSSEADLVWSRIACFFMSSSCCCFLMCSRPLARKLSSYYWFKAWFFCLITSSVVILALFSSSSCLRDFNWDSFVIWVSWRVVSLRMPSMCCFWVRTCSWYMFSSFLKAFSFCSISFFEAITFWLSASRWTFKSYITMVFFCSSSICSLCFSCASIIFPACFASSSLFAVVASRRVCFAELTFCYSTWILLYKIPYSFCAT